MPVPEPGAEPRLPARVVPPLSFPFPPAPTCLFTRKDDTRPCLQVLRQLTLAEHQRAVADGRL